MLKLHFINVGDGDAMLIEHLEANRTFRLLVDAGRADVNCCGDSLRLPCADYLKSLGISHLDAAVITHLHIDHFGGLRAVAEDVSIDSVYSGFFPAPGSFFQPSEIFPTKAEQGLVKCLSRWHKDCCNFRSRGISLHTVTANQAIPCSRELKISLIAPRPSMVHLQQYVFGELCQGKAGLEFQYQAAKSRNPASLRVHLEYAGRHIELSGDCLGEGWVKDAFHCDIWKVPHHADAKSVVPEIVDRIAPEIAVISCGREYVARKDRPSMGVIERLRTNGSGVYFTDAFAPGGETPSEHRALLVTVSEDGTLSIID